MYEGNCYILNMIAPDNFAYSTYLDAFVAEKIPSKKVPASFRWVYCMHKLFHNTEWPAR
jgi:hypothetical protein